MAASSHSSVLITCSAKLNMFSASFMTTFFYRCSVPTTYSAIDSLFGAVFYAALFLGPWCSMFDAHFTILRLIIASAHIAWFGWSGSWPTTNPKWKLSLG